MLTKDLLRVSRAGGGYQPQFADGADESVAARVIGCYQGHVGEPRKHLEEALTEIERESGEFKLVRGFAKLLEREAAFETRAAVDPERARRAAFEAAETVGVVTESEREDALARVAADLEVTPQQLAGSLYADREREQVLAAVGDRYDPSELRDQYNLSLAQTALFDAVEVRVQSSDPRAVISAVKRLGLLYEVRKLPAERRAIEGANREVVVTGPDALFTKSRRYGTSFGRLLGTVAGTGAWHLEATIDDRGTERELRLSDADLPDPGKESRPTFDSDVEAEFATRFEALDLDWVLHREPDPLAAGEHVVIPDFAFDWAHGEFRVYFEIMGFWTPEYVEKKLSRLAELEDVEMLVAVDESLGVGEELAAQDHRAIPYTRRVRVKDVRDALRRYERDLDEAAAERLPAALEPEADVIELSALASAHGVSERAIEDKSFPAHERVGRTLIRPAVLAELRERIEAGIELETAEAILEEYGIDDASAALAHLGYRVAWEGLGGGVITRREPDE